MFSLLLWSAAAVVGGTVLGLVGSLLRRAGWLAAAASALVAGAVLADAYLYVRGNADGLDAAALLDLLMVPVIMALGVRSAAQLLRVAVLAPPLGLVGWVLVSTPNRAEQLIITGSIH